MGWSCTTAADKTLKKWEAACLRSTGSSNAWRVPTLSGPADLESFFEVGDEQEDGSVVGEVFLTSTEKGLCRRTDRFRIEPDGTVSEAPPFLREVAR